MAYGLKYTRNFDSLNGIRYTFNIYEKDYAGADTEILLGGTPAVQDWQSDDSFSPVQGCVLKVQVVNDGSLPLSSFFSIADDTFKGELVSDQGVHFLGFLVQDDSTEIQVDYAHYINLSFTDNLGLLKDIPLNIANSNYGTVNSFLRTITRVDSHNFIFSGSPLPLQVGNVFTITGLPGANGTYTCSDITFLIGTYQIEVIETIPTFTGGAGTVNYTTPNFDLTDKLSFAELFAICLNSINLQLDCRVYSDLDVNGGTVGRWLEDVYLSGETFLNGGKWESCYRVMETILSRFRATIFQSKGVWNIVRWDELRENNGVIPYMTYDSDFTYVSTTAVHDPFFNYDAGEILTGLELGILRPYKFVRQQFNYVQPDNLLKNYNFQILGDLVREYTVTGGSVKEYELALWDDGPFAPYPERLIGITYDTGGNEVARYAVITGSSGDNPRSAQSQPIEVIKGDKFKWSFEFATDVSQPGAVNSIFSVRLFDGTTTRYLGDNGEWKVLNGFTYSVLAGDDTQEWHTVEIESDEIPYTGLLYIYLGQEAQVSSNKTYYKNLSFEYLPSINDTTKIIGHVHTNSQPVDTKNTDDSEIFIDDSPRNSIKGAMFLSTSTSLVRDRTLKWLPDDLRIGQITTFQELTWRKKPRLILSGTLLGIVQTSRAINKACVITSSIYTDLFFIIGQMSIDYKNDLVNVGLVEMYEDAETGVESVYEFKYLYAKI